MLKDIESRAPLFLRWLVLFASWIVSHPERAAWRSRWEGELKGWWMLVERGDLTAYSSREMARHIRCAAVLALWTRVDREHLRRVLNGPAVFLSAGCGLLALLAVASQGFAATRGVAAVFRTMLFLPAGLPLGAIPKHGGDTVFVFTAPIVFALGIAILWASFRPFHLHSQSWRYWGFLVAKVMVVLSLVTLAWIELSALVRAQIPPSDYRALLTGLAFRLIFIGAFVRAFGWCFTDQQQRCPVCMLRLAAPVSIGNRSNVFEPAVTEFMCERGHGVLSIPEVEGVEADRWTAFDSSWSELFETSAR